MGSDLASFNFKLLHGLLVTKQRIHHFTQGTAATCTHCDASVDEDLQHALVHCNYNNGVGLSLLSVAQKHLSHLTADSLLRLELAGLPEEYELPLVTLLSAGLSAIWDKRYTKSRITLYDIRATMEARCQLLRETRYKSTVPMLCNMINEM